jgi:LAO/AO transport system kinase
MKLNEQPAGFFIDGILNGDMAILSRAITLVESQLEAHYPLAMEIIDGIMPRSGNSFRLGITGVPGVGKSTFIERFGMEILRQDRKVAVLAIDPSSSISKGSILGDKTRMEQLSVQRNVFIRPTPAAGSLGGVSRSTYETILLCEAAGFNFIIVETVGVGQSEMAVSRITDFFLLLMLAGAGDELQGIKRGIVELADALVITKADSGNEEKAKIARNEYARAIHLLQPLESGWIPRTTTCSALTGEGIGEIVKMLEEYEKLSNTRNHIRSRRFEQQVEIFRAALSDKVLQKFYREKDIDTIVRSLRKKANFNPFREAEKITGT